MLCPATIDGAILARRVSKRNVDAPDPQRDRGRCPSAAGSAGAPGVSGVTTPSDATDQRKSGASSTSVMLARAEVAPGE